MSIYRFCFRCYKKILSKDGNCPNCGMQIGLEEKGYHFLSGPAISRDTLFQLPSDLILMDRFKIKKPLGKGRFAIVYLVEDIQRSLDLALKVVEAGPSCDDFPELQLKNELVVYDKISDFGHVIKVYDLHIAPLGGTNLFLLPMEYADGGTLRKWLLEHRDDSEARKTIGVDFFKQACVGVQAIHKAGLAHLDLKPENLLIKEKAIKVSDFGISRNILDLNAANPKLMSGVSGTPAYMAPEQTKAARPKDVDYLADIYALGCILFEILDGDPPYMGTPIEILEKHNLGIKPDFRGIDEHLANIILRCLSKEPINRYKTISDLLSAIDGKPIRAEGGGQWYSQMPDLLQQVKEKLLSIGAIIEIFDDDGNSDLTIDLSSEFCNKRYPFRFIFPSNYPNGAPKVLIRSQPLQEQLAANGLLTPGNEVSLSLDSGKNNSQANGIESLIDCLVNWMRSVHQTIVETTQWYKRDPELLQSEIEKLKKIFGKDFRYDEINPQNQNMTFSIRINLNERRFWVGIEFPKDYPNEIPLFFLKGDYVKQKLFDVFVDGIINVHENIILNWHREKDIKNMVLSITRMMENFGIDEKFDES